MTICLRVYLSGHYTVEEPVNVAEWVVYNRAYRPGCALFVGHACLQQGYLAESKCKEIAQKIATLDLTNFRERVIF